MVQAVALLWGTLQAFQGSIGTGCECRASVGVGTAVVRTGDLLFYLEPDW